MNFNIFSWNKPVVTDKKIVVPKINRQTNRTQQSTLEWRQAVFQAEDPNFPYRTLMIQLYQDTILNGQVIACMERRKELTLLRDWEMIKPSGVVDEKAHDLLNTEWFHKFINYALDANYYGYSLIQLGSIIDNEFKNITIARREFVSPDRNLILDYPSTPVGIDFTDAKYNNWNILVKTINPAGVSPTGYGLLYPVGLLEIHLRNILGFNADYLELYTQPLRVGKTDKTTEEERDFLEQALDQFGSNGWVLLDKEDEIEFMETNKTGSNNYLAYSDLEKRLEQKISKIILGHADALDSTSGKLGATQGEETPVWVALRDKRNTDAAFIEKIINYDLIPRMNALGFNIKSEFKFKNDDEQRNDAIYLTETAVQLAQAGLRMDRTYYSEKTGIPIEAIQDVVSNGVVEQVNNQDKAAKPVDTKK